MTAKLPFLITIDTEGDNLWSRPREVTTHNSRYLARFQELCERHGLQPCWLTNYEMACCPVFQEFARDVLARRTGEIGMHLHAWNSPPIIPLTSDDYRYQPYLIDYPNALQSQKVDYLTSLLEDVFHVPIKSHRAGRWAMNSGYAEILSSRGYTTDCSVTPFVTWRHMAGAPGNPGGSDYRYSSTEAHIFSAGQAKGKALLEIPMTIRPNRLSLWQLCSRRMGEASRVSLVKRVAARLFPEVSWLRPTGRNLSAMLSLLKVVRHEPCTHIEFMLHSSELMPGGSPRFPTARSIEALYHDLETLFREASEHCRGVTLSEFQREFAARSNGAPVHCQS